MKTEYETVELEIIEFSLKDVVLTSGGNNNETEEGDP